jgi:hypothetical protein
MWITAGDNRWDWTADDDRHLMLLDPTTRLFAELHGQWVHRYRAPEPIDQEWPLTGAEHIDTVLRDDPIDSDEQGWTVLAEAAKAATP